MTQEQETKPRCKYCGGETRYIGMLASSHIFRCRDCGLESFTIEQKEEQHETSNTGRDNGTRD